MAVYAAADVTTSVNILRCPHCKCLAGIFLRVSVGLPCYAYNMTAVIARRSSSHSAAVTTVKELPALLRGAWMVVAVSNVAALALSAASGLLNLVVSVKITVSP